MARRPGGQARRCLRCVGEPARGGRRPQAAAVRSRRASGFRRASAGARAGSGSSRAAPLIMDITGVLAVVFLFGGGTLFLLSISPIGEAVAERIRGKGQQTNAGELRTELVEHRESLEQELEAVRREMAELAERVDFTERLLAKQREAERLAPPRS